PKSPSWPSRVLPPREKRLCWADCRRPTDADGRAPRRLPDPAARDTTLRDARPDRKDRHVAAVSDSRQPHQQAIAIDFHFMSPDVQRWIGDVLAGRDIE